MNATKLLICTIVGAIYMYLVDFLWYVFVTGEGMNADTPQPHHLAMILGYLIFAALFSTIYAKGVERGSPTQQGLRFGVMIGLLVALPYALLMYGISPTAPEYDLWSDLGEVLRDGAYEVVKVVILGVIVAHLSGVRTNSDRSNDIDGRGDIGGGGGTEPRPPAPEPPGGGEN
jgi:hypothetical protein